MVAQELRPPGLSSTHGRGLNSMILKDAFDGVVHDDVAKILERPLDTSLAPAGIVLCHLDDEILDLLHDAMASFAGFVRPFLRDQFAMPGQQCVGRDNGCVLTEQTTTYFPAFGGEATTLCISQTDLFCPALFLEDSVLFTEVVENLLLFSIQPASEGRDEEERAVLARSSWGG